MRLLDMPFDLLHHMAEYLDVLDFSRWRLVVRRMFRARHVIEYSHARLQSLKPRTIRRCVLCSDDALSHLEWKHGSRRQSVPWCAAHIDEDILMEIDIYCVRSLGVNLP